MSINDRLRIYYCYCTIPTANILYYKRGGRKIDSRVPNGQSKTGLDQLV